jgi:hypothetical protein
MIDSPQGSPADRISGKEELSAGGGGGWELSQTLCGCQLEKILRRVK